MPVAPDALPIVRSEGIRSLGLGSVVDRRYCLRRTISVGGGGTVYEAEHLVSRRRVALKLVHPGEAGWAEKRARLLREARALVLARQPNVVEVLDAGSDESGAPYLAMELLEGRSLDGILAARRQLSAEDTVALGLELCRVLGHAHRRGIVHRDVKPGNVFVTLDGTGDETIKLVDFGIARLLNEETDTLKITRVGAIVGTPEYLPPEQLMGRDDCDHRADIYSLGVLLFECVTGGVPFDGSFGEVLLRASTEPTPSARTRNPEVPEGLDAALLRAMARDPAARFRDMVEMSDALAALATSGARPRLLLGQRDAPVGPTLPPARITVPDRMIRQDSRRRFPRSPYVTPIRLIMPDGSNVDGRTEDISEGGILALMPQRCDNDLPVQARFALPVTGKIVTVQARSRWVRVARVGVAAGLEFLALSTEQRETIRRYVALMRGE